MKKHLKQYFVPHEENDHKPHALRGPAILGLALAIVAILGLSALQLQVVTNSERFLASVLPGVLVDLTNDDREKRDLHELEHHPLLERAAQLKANHMAENGYFAHNSPDGTTPWEWFYQAGYQFQHAGENLAVNFSDSQDVEDAWMDSPGHRANILNGDFTQIGIATAKGEYKGRETVFVVQMFGTPAPGFEATDSRLAQSEEDDNEVDGVQTNTADDTDTETETDVTAEEPDDTSNQQPAYPTSYDDFVAEQEPAPTRAQTQAPAPEPAPVATPEPVTSEPIAQAPSDTAAEEPEPTKTPTSSAPAAATTSTTSQSGNLITETDDPASQGSVARDRVVALQPDESLTYSGVMGYVVSRPTLILELTYLLVGLIIVIALAMTVGIEIDKHHPMGVFYGVALIVLLVVCTYYAREYLFPTVEVMSVYAP